MDNGSDKTETDSEADMSDEHSEPTQAEILSLIDRLKDEHRRIDQEIDALIETGVADMLKVKRMKKIKLSMKDQIAYLQNQVTPDIIA